MVSFNTSGFLRRTASSPNIANVSSALPKIRRPSLPLQVKNPFSSVGDLPTVIPRTSRLRLPDVSFQRPRSMSLTTSIKRAPAMEDLTMPLFKKPKPTIPEVGELGFAGGPRKPWGIDLNINNPKIKKSAEMSPMTPTVGKRPPLYVEPPPFKKGSVVELPPFKKGGYGPDNVDPNLAYPGLGKRARKWAVDRGIIEEGGQFNIKPGKKVTALASLGMLGMNTYGTIKGVLDDKKAEESAATPGDTNIYNNTVINPATEKEDPPPPPPPPPPEAPKPPQVYSVVTNTQPTRKDLNQDGIPDDEVDVVNQSNIF